MTILKLALTATSCLAILGTAAAQTKPDPFYLPQPNQPFGGKVETLIGTLEFSNQYPSKQSI